MRLLLVTDAVGGVWVYSVELARALRLFGVEAALAVMGPSPDARQRVDADHLKLIDTGLPLDWLDTSPAELRRAGDVIADIAARENVDVVQTCSAALLANTQFDRPCVAVQHSCVATWWAAVKGTRLPHEFAWRRELVEQGLNRSRSVVAPTNAFAAETARTYDLSTPVLAVHNGRRPTTQASLPPADFVLTASRLWDEGKDVATLDAAAARLKVPFEAAGPASGPNRVRASFDHLHQLGQLSAARLSSLLAARPIYASAAVYEPFGLSVLEAAHAGCALVLSDIATHRELWGGAAIFVPAREPDAFASAIQELLGDRDQREDLGQIARDRARSYSPERMAEQMAAIYARAASDALVAPTRLAMAGAA